MKWDKSELRFFEKGPVTLVCDGVIFSDTGQIVNAGDQIECPYCKKKTQILSLRIIKSQMLDSYRNGESKSIHQVLCTCKRKYNIYDVITDICDTCNEYYVSKLDTFEECLKVIQMYPTTFDLMPPRFRTNELLLASKL